MLLPSIGHNRSNNAHGPNSSPGLSGPSMMELDSDDHAAAAPAAPSAAASSSSAAASAPSASSLLPAAPPMLLSANSLVHPSRRPLLVVGGAVVAVPAVARRADPTVAASSAASAKQPKGALPPGLASMFTADQLQQITAATESTDAASASCADPAAASASAASAAASAPSRLPLSQLAPTHCLVFHPALFDAQSNDRVEHAKALACGSSSADVESVVRSWQPALADSMLCASGLATTALPASRAGSPSHSAIVKG